MEEGILVVRSISEAGRTAALDEQMRIVFPPLLLLTKTEKFLDDLDIPATTDFYKRIVEKNPGGIKEGEMPLGITESEGTLLIAIYRHRMRVERRLRLELAPTSPVRELTGSARHAIEAALRQLFVCRHFSENEFHTTADWVADAIVNNGAPAPARQTEKPRMHNIEHMKALSKDDTAAIGDRVIIDGDASIKAVVIGFMIQRSRTQYQLAWFANGIAQEDWFEDWRLTKV